MLQQIGTPSNWQALKFHELADLNPETPAEQFAELKADIADNGPRVAVVLYEGQILDGRTRHRACVELGTEPEFAEFIGTADEARAFVLSMETRRHLSRDERAKLVQKLRSEGRSLRGIADETGIPKSTVADLLNSGVRTRTPEEPDALEQSGVPNGTPEPDEVDEPDEHDAGVRTRTPEPATAPQPPAAKVKAKVKGRDGKQYPARKKRRKYHEAEAEERFGEMLDLVAKCSAAITAAMKMDCESGRRFRQYLFDCELAFLTNGYEDESGEFHETKEEQLALRGVAMIARESCKIRERQLTADEIRARWKKKVADKFVPNPKNELYRAQKKLAAEGGAA